MTALRGPVALLFIGLAGGSPARAQTPPEAVLTRPLEDRRDLTLLRRVSERTYVHEIARVSFTVPDGWTVIPPHRAARRIDSRFSTLLGAERSDRAAVASLVWTQLDPGARPTDWVRDSPVRGEYGEEYETLKAVYGRDRVAIPARSKVGPLDVYRIDVRGGPGFADPAAGTLFVLFVESRGTTWLIKARVTSSGGPGHAADAAAVLAGFALSPNAAGATHRRAVDVDVRIPPPGRRPGDGR